MIACVQPPRGLKQTWAGVLFKLISALFPMTGKRSQRVRNIVMRVVVIIDFLKTSPTDCLEIVNGIDI